MPSTALHSNIGSSECTIKGLTHLNEFCHLQLLFSRQVRLYVSPVERGFFTECKSHLRPSRVNTTDKFIEMLVIN